MRNTGRNSIPAQRNQLITWKEAVSILEQCDTKGVPIPFDVVFVTADESRNTGGEYIHYEQAVWSVPGNRVTRSGTFTKATGKAPSAKRSGNQTMLRRIRGLQTDEIRTVDLQLILFINGLSVK